MKKIRVLMLGPDRSVHGGVSAMVNNLYEAGLDQKVELYYIGTMIDGSKVRKLLCAVYAYLKFLCVIKGYDIIHINMASDASYYRKKIFVDTAYLFHKKIVIHEHGGNFVSFYNRMNLKQQQNVKKTLNKASAFIVLSREWKKFFSDIVTVVPIQIMHNAVPVPDEGRRDYSDHNVLFLGRICTDKGMTELLAAADRLDKKIPDMHLYLGGIYEDLYWKKEVEKRSRYITCVGWITGADKEKMLKDVCSVFVLPSYYEGQPVSLMEAMSYGLASIASDIGGITEVMGSNEGVLIPVKDSNALTNALKNLVTDTGKKNALGTAARNRIIADYDISRMVENLVGLYANIGELI